MICIRAAIRRVIALSVFLAPTALFAQGVMPGTFSPGSPNPYSGTPRGTGDIHSFNYPRFHAQGMSGQIGRLSVDGAKNAPGIPYVTNPYSGMFGSMGNVYSHYYRRPNQIGMSGPLTNANTISVIHYIISPYAGMYGSMGNVYSPYYRQFHHSGMSGSTAVLVPGGVQGQVIQYHYPYFLPPTMGAM